MCVEERKLVQGALYVLNAGANSAVHHIAWETVWDD